MRIGIDFGTTRIVVATADRGNYPVVTFEGPDGAAYDWFPPLVAVQKAARIYGFEAWAAQQEPGWTLFRSVKRLLGESGFNTRIEIGDQVVPMHQLLTELVSTLKRDLLERSTLRAVAGDRLEVMLGVPANANTNQRFLTAEAFRLGGFDVIGLLNEPSAASIEFGHFSRRQTQADQKGWVLVYDFGGGTFDVSLVELDRSTHTVQASEGIANLGGDDFDEILAETAMDVAGISKIEASSLSQAELFQLVEECRQKKEALHPNSRRIPIELDVVREGWPAVSVPVSAFYAACEPLVEETLSTVEAFIERHGPVTAGSVDSDGKPRIEALYVIGGGSDLPLVTRRVKERFGRRARRSTHARAATAIGLAIQADVESGYVLRDRFMRYFGVWREADGGRRVAFDPLFVKGLALPGPNQPALATERHYNPMHNIGHFRYLECSHLTDDGRPAGDITVWDDILFPFDPALTNGADLKSVAVVHSDAAARQNVVERYSCDAGGSVHVTLSNLSEPYTRTYRLARWASLDTPIKPGRRKRSRRS